MDLLDLDLESLEWPGIELPTLDTEVAVPTQRNAELNERDLLAAAMDSACALMPWALESEREELLKYVQRFVQKAAQSDEVEQLKRERDESCNAPTDEPKRARVIPTAAANAVRWNFHELPNVVSVICLTTNPLRLEFSSRPSKPGNHAVTLCFATETELVELDRAAPTRQTKAAIHRLKRALCVFSGLQLLPRDLYRVLLSLKWGHKGIKNMAFDDE